MENGLAGPLLREARQKAGLSQAELGRRAGVTQSVVSAYESGARQPSVPTLQRLIEATGSELEIGFTEPGPGRESVGKRLRRHRRQIKELVARHGLSNVRVFGSAARGDDTEASDIDLLVDVPPGMGLLGLARCQRDLEVLLGVPIDLVPASDLKPGVAGSVLAEARRL